MLKLTNVFSKKSEVGFDEKAHTYRLNGVDGIIVGVTKIINPKPFFQSPKIKAAAQLGQELHKLFGMYYEWGNETEYDAIFSSLVDKINEESLKKGLAPLAQCRSEEYYREHRFIAEFTDSESNRKFYVGGTCDFLVVQPTGFKIVELKTTTTESPDHLTQVAAYTKFAEFVYNKINNEEPENALGLVAYLGLRGQGGVVQIVRSIDKLSLEAYWTLFLRKVEEYFSNKTLPEKTTIVRAGNQEEWNREHVEELIKEYCELCNDEANLVQRKKEIRETLDAIAALNNLNNFEINGAKYAKIQGVRRFCDTEYIESHYPGLINYAPFERVTIGYKEEV